MRHLLSFMLRKLRDQRGEVGDEEDSKTDEVLNEDDVVEDDDVVEIDPDELEEIEEEEDPNEPGEEDQRVKDLEAKLAKQEEVLKEQEGKVKESNRNFYGLRKKLKAMETKGDDKDANFSDAQLIGMIEEHQDEPGTMLQIMKQVGKQAASGEADVRIKAVEASQRKKEMDSYLLKTYPDAYDEGSENHKSIQQAKEYLHLTDHPLGDFLAGSSTMFLQVPEMLENVKKEARENALKVEDARKKNIKQNSLESGKKKTASKELSSNYRSTAKQLGLSKSQTAIYAKLLTQGKTATVEV